MEVAAAAGIVAGDPDKGLEVISQVTEQQQAALADFIDSTPITVRPTSSELVLDISIHLFAGEENATVRIINHHTGLTYIQHNGEVLFDEKPSAPTETNTLDYTLLTVADIYDFACSLDVSDVKELFDRQITTTVHCRRRSQK